MQFSYKLKYKIRRLESEKQILKKIKKSVNMALIRFHGTLTSPALCDIFSLFFLRFYWENKVLFGFVTKVKLRYPGS